MLDVVKNLLTLRARLLEARDLLNHERRRTEIKALEVQMGAPDFWTDQNEATAVSKKHESLRAEIQEWDDLEQEISELVEIGEMPDAEHDEDVRAQLTKRYDELVARYEKMEFYLLFSEQYDDHNVVLGIHSGTGGVEAMDWAEMLQRMYLRFAEKKGWRVEIVDLSRGTEAGIKSAIMTIEGRWAYGNLKSEHGVHRLVRQSPFNADHLRQTSFALVEVLPQIETDTELVIDPKDVRLDTMTAGGHGGQSVNTTYSAVRLVHLPTGIIVTVQNERSQLQNRETAWKILRAKLLKLKLEEQKKDREDLRGEHKSAEWGNQIRSYVLHPYHLVKDLRTRYETSDTDAVLDGDLDAFVEAYLRWLRVKDKSEHAAEPDFEE